MGKNRILIFNLFVIFIFIGLIGYSILIKKSSSKKSISPNILLITQPVYSFSGVVEKIEGNTLTLTQKVTEQLPIIPPQINPNTPVSPFPTPKTIILTYRFLITDKTQISRPPTYINYLFKNTPPPPVPKLTIKDIKVGQSINVYTQTDLRTFTGNTLEATSISLPPILNTLNGKVLKIEKNTLTIKAFPPFIPDPSTSPQPLQEKEYKIIFTEETEISRMNQQGAPEKLSLSDIKKDTQINIYVAEDVTQNQKLTALRLEPIISLPPMSSPSATLSP